MQRIFIAVMMLVGLSLNAAGADFVDNGNGTVTDRGTGLMWQQETTAPMTWGETLSYCEDLILAGYDDWRWPSRDELLSIVDKSTFNPAIDTGYFPETQPSNYWTGDTVAEHRESAWVVNFGGGDVYEGLKSDAAYVRAVRGGGQQ